MSRPLENEEKNTLTSTLKLMLSGDHDPFLTDPPEPADPTPYLSQVDYLMVTSECECGQVGCRSVFFTNKYRYKGAYKEIAPVAEGTREGSMVIVYAHNETGELVEMEVIGG